MGYMLLEGGSEFQGRMAEPDRVALKFAGGRDATVSIIPSAAVPDHNHERAGSQGVAWFRALGATDVSALPLIDSASANDPRIATQLKNSTLIFILGGFPGYLAQVLTGSRAWQAMAAAHDNGAVIAGSSAGAMVLCEDFFDPKAGRIKSGLGLVPRICVLPHHNKFGATWAPKLASQLPHTTLVGIDEQTGVLFPGADNRWQISGKGAVTLYRQGRCETYHAGDGFDL